jgi:hypothetical protein
MRINLKMEAEFPSKFRKISTRDITAERRPLFSTKRKLSQKFRESNFQRHHKEMRLGSILGFSP